MKTLLFLFVLAICVCPALSMPQKARPQLQAVSGTLIVRADGSVVWNRSKARLAALRAQFDRSEFPGGDLLLLSDQQFLWEGSDVSGLFLSPVSEVEVQSVVNGPVGVDAKVMLSVYTKDNHYYLVVLGDEATKALAKGLIHGGFGSVPIN